MFAQKNENWILYVKWMKSWRHQHMFYIHLNWSDCIIMKRKEEEKENKYKQCFKCTSFRLYWKSLHQVQQSVQSWRIITYKIIKIVK